MDLLARAVEEDDLELAAIAIAADHHELDAARVRAELDAMAAVVRKRLGERKGPARVRALLRAFFRDLAFHAPDEYGDAELHRIDRVLVRRMGSPVALAVVLIALGRRVGVELEPVAFPGHFLLRARGGALIDPCTGAMPIPEDALCELAVRELDLPRSSIDALLDRASARVVAVRMLENLQQVYRDRGERRAALLVEERLLALGGPAASAERLAASLMHLLRPPVARARRLTVHRQGFSFQLDDAPPVDLRRRRALPLLLVRLAEHHQTAAAHGLGWPALIEAGWPSEKIQPDAAWARLRTAIRTLRKLGLADVLITVGTGYLLDPSCDVRWR